jgi:RNA polymerase sigma factor (sigma-70 family)
MPERLFFEIDRRFKEEHEASRLGRRLREWSSDHPSLARFEDADALVRFFRDLSIDYEPKDPIAGILCVLSRNDELAQLLLLKLYLPGLISKRSRWGLDGRGLTRDEVDAALVAGLLDRAAEAKPEATERLSGRLVTAGGNRVRKEIRERTRPPTRRVRRAKRVRSDPAEVDDVADEARAREAAAELINRAHAEGGIRQNDAEVLLARTVEKLSTRETAARFGISESAAKLRLHRARERLNRWLQADPGPETSPRTCNLRHFR